VFCSQRAVHQSFSLFLSRLHLSLPSGFLINHRGPSPPHFLQSSIRFHRHIWPDRWFPGANLQTVDSQLNSMNIYDICLADISHILQTRHLVIFNGLITQIKWNQTTVTVTLQRKCQRHKLWLLNFVNQFGSGLSPQGWGRRLFSFHKHSGFPQRSTASLTIPSTM